MVQVAIIGGGLAGLTLALYLKKAGVIAAVYEGKSEDFVSGGNIALSPNALRVLDHIGVYERLRPAGFEFDEVAFMNGRGATLARVLGGSYKVYNYPALRIRRTVLRGELLSEIRSQDVPIYYDRKCAGIREETKDSATVDFEDGESITAEYVVGADGIHSCIRPFIRPDAKPEFQDLAGISGTFKLSDLPDVDTSLYLPCMLFGANGTFAIMPASADGDEVSYFATFELKDRGREEWAALDNDKKEMSRMLAERFPPKSAWPELVRALCERAPPSTLTLWPFYQVSAGQTWISPKKRVILIGDAAHAMPPTGGQGGASSFEDAETLGYTLAHLFAPDFNNSARSSVIQVWEQHRIPRVQKIMDFTSKNGNLRKTSASALHQLVKEGIIWGYIKLVGPKMGSEWIYTYNGECIRGELADLGRSKKPASQKL